MYSVIYQFLNEPRILREKISEIEREIEELRVSMLPGAIRYDKDSVQSSGRDPMIQYAVRIDELSRKESILQKKYRRALDKVIDAVDYLPQSNGRVIVLKYIDDRSNGYIADQMGISKRHVMRLCEEAYDILLNIVLMSPLKYDIL